ncbi:type IV pilin [Natronoarchaeum mannanilyticum]|uniref:Archaeal Type IV pilin N-terminal domain-containing protein n=1 Tax=Natronoarchaeum mannanilyticum TaxID=926360 RepID=A0AAV3TDL5_9EURY
MDRDLGAERGQSEVIGVVLLVGIVVLLAGLAGLFIFDLSDNNLEKAPQTNFEVDQYGDNTSQVRLYHDGGDVITDTDAITVTVDGNDELAEHGVNFSNADGEIDSQTDVFFSKNGSSDIIASESTLNGSYGGLDAGTEIRIVWNPEDADNSAILFEYEVESRS